MRKKYTYFVDDVEVSKEDFKNELEKCCQKVTHTDVIANWCGVDFVGFDEKMFNEELRSISNGIHVMLPDGYNSRTYKLFYREEI